MKNVFNHSVPFIAWPFGVTKSHTPMKECIRTVKSVRTYARQVFFFMNADMYVENRVYTFLCPCCAYTTFIHQAPGLYLSRKLLGTTMQASTREYQGEGFELSAKIPI